MFKRPFVPPRQTIGYNSQSAAEDPLNDLPKSEKKVCMGMQSAAVKQDNVSIQNMSRGESSASTQSEYFKVMFCKQDSFFKKQASKGYVDGMIEVTRDQGNLFNEAGKSVWLGKVKQVSGQGAVPAAKAAFQRRLPQSKKGKEKKARPDEGYDEDNDDDVIRFECGSWIVEVESSITSDRFRSGAVFVNGGNTLEASSASTLGRPRTAGSGFKAPGILGSAAPSAPRAYKPLYDPKLPGALLLNEDRANIMKGVMPVVVDPYLARSLRLHQIEGVRFLYRSTMEPRSESASGCILADEMGLGKTLQVITLIWTLLRQGPGMDGRAAIQKAIVVTPATLVQQWVKEVTKWLGSERLSAVALVQSTDTSDVLSSFKHRSVGGYQRQGLLVTSYETLRKFAPDLQGCCDLLVCDEAHRLKSLGGNKTVDALLSLGCKRRVLLTGTPVQNNLDEFYSLLSFVAPNVLDSAAVFKRVYSEPISRGRDAAATQADRDLGNDRAKEMADKVAPYMLRRTSDILNKHLPPLSQLVVFCRPSETQIRLYRHLLKNSAAAAAATDQSPVLAVISALRKVCNSPSILMQQVKDPSCGSMAPTSGDDGTLCEGSLISSWLKGSEMHEGTIGSAGKLECLSGILDSIISAKQRCVLVSTSTVALTLIELVLCIPRGYTTVRIDGDTKVSERQNIVDGFNARGRGQVFMLSTRAGGAGLNLIGASNLVLYDSDWNPAMDAQAMARIWRDGQRLPCTVYRLLTAGTIEEKIYQRQIMKGDLAMAAGSGGSKVSASGCQFTKDDLRDLFKPATLDMCDTQELMRAQASDDSDDFQQSLDWLDLDAGEGGKPQLYHHLGSCISSGVVIAIAKVKGAANMLEGQEDERELQGEGLQQQRVQPPVQAAVDMGATSGSWLKNRLLSEADEADVALEDLL